MILTGEPMPVVRLSIKKGKLVMKLPADFQTLTRAFELFKTHEFHLAVNRVMNTGVAEELPIPAVAWLGY